MQKIKKLISVIAIILLIIMIIPKESNADVGSFESYDSGSDWSSSSSWDDDDWDTSSSWDDDDWDTSSSGSSSSGGSIGGIVATVIILGIIYIIVKSLNKIQPAYTKPMHTVQNTITHEPDVDETVVESKIKETDELFNKEEFNQKAKMLFIKMQNAWMDRKWEEIRPFETDELFEQHQGQIEGYIRNKQINVMDRICVLYSKLYKYEQKGDKEVLHVVLKSRMADYIIDEDTKEILKGDKNIERIKLYRLEFIMKLGVKTKAEETGLDTTNCPNCGAPTKVTSSGECDYCGSIITNGDFGWVLNNLEPFQTK